MSKLSETIWQVLSDESVLKKSKNVLSEGASADDKKSTGSAAEKTLKGGGEGFGLGKKMSGTEYSDNESNSKAYKEVVGANDPAKLKTEEDEKDDDKDLNEEDGDTDLEKGKSGSAAEKTLGEEDDKEDDKELDEEDEKDDEDKVEEGKLPPWLKKKKTKKESDDKDEDDKLEESDDKDEDDLNEESGKDEEDKVEEGWSKKKMKKEEDDKELDEEDEKEKELDEEDEKEIEKVDVKEGVEAIFQGEKLSKRFQEKVAVVFESFIRAKMIEVAKKIDQRYAKKLQEATKKYEVKVSDAVSRHMDYATTEWLNENKVAVESSIKSDIVESFMGGLKNLFESHYVTVPESKVDLVDALARKLEDTQAALNEQINKNIEMKKTILESRKADMLKEFTEDLTKVDAEKLSKLVEGLSFNSEKQFKEKVKILKESSFPRKSAKKDQDLLVEGGIAKPAEVPSEMDVFAAAISRTVL